MTPIQTEHQGIAIVYDERENKWKFELRGRKRSAESLEKAREAIDKPAPVDETPFEPINGWLWKYSGDPKPVIVTSIAEPCRYSGSVEVWVKTKDGTRSKERLGDVLSDAPEVAQLVKEHNALERQRTQLYEAGEKKKAEAMKFKLKLP